MTNQLHKLLLLIVATFFTCNAYAYDVKINGIYYNLDKTSQTASVTEGGSLYTGNVTIPASITHNDITYSVTSIGMDAFAGCGRLTSVDIPSSVKSIGSSAFNGCSGLTSINISEGVTSIGLYAFNECSGLTSIDIPSSVTSIGLGAFKYCSGLTTIDIPASVTSIEGNTFQYCSGLTSVNIPSSVTSIDAWAFSYCTELTSIDIPASVTSIGYYAFYGCSGLTAINISSDNPAYCFSDGIIYDKEKTTLILCLGTKTGSVSIPESVTSIEYYAFFGCSGLTSIYSFNPMPPTASYCFNDDNFESATLYVPQEAIEAYRAADGWSSFQNIQGFDPSGIKGVEAEGSNRPAAYYDANGRKSATPHHGVNIVRMTDGTTRKVMIK